MILHPHLISFRPFNYNNIVDWSFMFQMVSTYIVMIEGDIDVENQSMLI